MTLLSLIPDTECQAVATEVWAAWQPKPRSYTVDYQRSYIPNAPENWRLRIYGDGHWCTADGHQSRHATEIEAHRAGRAWVATGLAPAEQGV